MSDNNNQDPLAAAGGGVGAGLGSVLNVAVRLDIPLLVHRQLKKERPRKILQPPLDDLDEATAVVILTASSQIAVWSHYSALNV